MLIVMLGGGDKTCQSADIAAATELAIAEYMSLVLEDGEPDELIRALGHVAKARGMTEIAKASGWRRTPAGRQSMPECNRDQVAAVVPAIAESQGELVTPASAS